MIYIILNNLLLENTNEQSRILYHIVPIEAVESVKKYGLLSSIALSKHPDALALARPDAKERKEWLEKLKKDKSPHRLGPNLLFSKIPKSINLPKTHPIKKYKCVYIKLNLNKLLQDILNTKFYGIELQPLENTCTEYSDEQWKKLDKKEQDRCKSLRSRYITLNEVDKILKRNAIDLWKDYSGESGMYAPNVPHVAVITPNGIIGSEYLVFE